MPLSVYFGGICFISLTKLLRTGAHCLSFSASKLKIAARLEG